MKHAFLSLLTGILKRIVIPQFWFYKFIPCRYQIIPVWEGFLLYFLSLFFFFLFFISLQASEQFSKTIGVIKDLFKNILYSAFWNFVTAFQENRLGSGILTLCVFSPFKTKICPEI